ncbi:MAG TPA: M14 family zinc carboxypeptidase [Xanthomonadales bacterium]|nr:M14 family zinc carboxypeptidase [Xanthomonadales bacterium]
MLLCVRVGLAADAAPSSRLPPDSGPWVVRAYFDSKAQLATVTRRTEPWEVNHDQGYALIEVANRFEYSQLLANDFKLSIDAALTEFVRNPAVGLRNVPGFGCYRTVEETLTSIDQIVAAHPTLASSVDIGDSWEKQRNAANGYDLKVLRLSNSAVAGPKPKAFMLGAIHAREYTTAETLMRFAERLLARYPLDADVRWMLDNYELHLLPQANPDGRKKAEIGLLWRKNVNEDYCGASSNSRGADLNRNFPFEWGAHSGSSGNPCDDSFRGAAASSEPETSAIVAYLQTLFPDQRPPDLTTPAPADLSGVFLDVHSYGRLVMWPWGFDGSIAPNGAAMTTLGRRLGWINGYRPQQGVELYVTDGGTRDFVYGELGVPALSFELGNSFFESCASFESDVLETNIEALTYLLRNTRRPYQDPDGPSMEQLASAPVEPGEPIQLIGLANDAAFNQSNGSEAVQAVAGVDVYFSRLPWTGPNSPDASATAADGAYDTATETFRAELASGDLDSGSYAIYLRARDGNGHGPTYAHAVDVVAPGTTARLMGSISNANTGSTLALPARVQLGDYATLALPATGSSYSLRAPSGNYTIEVSAPGYAPKTLAGIALTAPASVQQNIALTPICTLLADDASAGLANFNAQSPWGLGNTRFVSAPAAFTDSPDSDYAANANTSLSLVPLDLREISHVHLKFQSWCDTEAGLDYGRVEISTTGSVWTEVWSCSGSAAWTAVDLDLGALDDQSSALIRFRLTSDSAVQREGWSIDDLLLSGAGLVCGGVPDALFADGFE